MFALEAVGLTGLGVSQLQCDSLSLRQSCVSLCEGGELTPSIDLFLCNLTFHIIFYLYAHFILDC